MVKPPGCWLCAFALCAMLRCGQPQYLFTKKTIALIYRGEIIDNPAYFNSTLRMYSVNPSQSGFLHDYETYLLVPLHRFRLHAQFLVLMNEQYEASIYNRTIDACAFLRRPREPLIKAVFDELRQNGRLPTRCPVPPGKFYFRNCTFNKSQIPPFLPEGNFQFNMRVLVDRLVILEHHWFGKLKKL